MELPVDICKADTVVINEHQMPHPGPGQSFRHIGTYAADAKDRDLAGRQLCQSFLPHQQPGTGKSVYISQEFTIAPYLCSLSSGVSLNAGMAKG